MLEHMEIALGKIGRTLLDEFKRQPIYYNADHLHIFGTDVDVPWPTRSQWIDYELEWACVIGRTAANITPETARDHIFGFTIFNDWSARDLQIPFMECGLGPGAGKDFANGLGPCIATLDEFEDIYDLRMTARVNGEQWSDGTTGSMFHKWEDAIAELSVDRTLAAGEVIGSGTVLSGCGFEVDRRLAIGDMVELEIEGIGVLRNRVVAG
jgi:2-keto-4-pentenoate hydratase/2-oxohepta-3-ene-1,7-dioic acid hydratase in catechol pathway